MVKYSFPIEITSGALSFGPEVNFVEMNERMLSDLKGVLYKNNGIDFDCSIYKMYRSVELNNDQEIFKDIRHDITSMPAGKINGEFVKTFGHYHPKYNALSYPEIYQVVNGKAVFILQDDKDPVSEIFFVFANTNEIIIIPPGFGHISINISPDNLVLANLIFTHFDSLYEPYERKKGAAYYLTEDSPLEWKANLNYKNLPEPKLVRPLNPWNNQFIYDLFKNNSSNLQFLAEPNHFPFKKEEILAEKPLTEIYQQLAI